MSSQYWNIMVTFYRFISVFLELCKFTSNPSVNLKPFIGYNRIIIKFCGNELDNYGSTLQWHGKDTKWMFKGNL